MMNGKTLFYNLGKLVRFIYRFRGLEKNLIMFFSNPPLSSNAKAIYDYIIDNGLNKKFSLKLRWIIPKYFNLSNKNDLHGIDYCIMWNKDCISSYLKSSILIMDSVLMNSYRFIRNPKTKIILTWHGVGYKIGSFLPLNSIVDKAITTSNFGKVLLSSYLTIDPRKFEVTGFPRNDKLLNTDKKWSKQILSKILKKDLSKYSGIWFYLPTYRFDPNTGNKIGKPIINFSYMENEVLDKLDKFLKRENIMLVVKYHQYDERYFTLDTKIRDKMTLGNYSNIKLVSSNELVQHKVTIYDLLPASDLLITDYSSISIDYLLLNKPIVFYLFDFEDYYRKYGLLFDKENMNYFLPGPIAFNGEELFEVLEESEANRDPYSSDRERVKRMFHKYTDNKSAERFFNIVLKKYIDDQLT